jgi:hypothetical protein
MPANKQLFYDVIKEATGKPIPPMPGSSRYSTADFATIQNLFSKVDVHVFENPLTFETSSPSWPTPAPRWRKTASCGRAVRGQR